MSEELETLLREAGARFAQEDGVRLPRDFGDAAAEVSAVRAGCAVVWRADRRVVAMHGRDPVQMLHGLVTNDLAAAEPGRAVYSAMLTPKGRVITDLRTVRESGGNEARLVVEIGAAAAEATAAHLGKFVPPMFAKWEWADRLVLGVYGPDGLARLEDTGIGISALAEDEVRHLEHEGRPVVAVGTAYTGGPGVDLIVGAATAADLWRRLIDAGAVPAGHAAVEVLRVEAGRPRPGAELTEDVIATEAFEGAGLMERAISFSKGCYTGQEVIVRIAHRGKVNRLLRGLRLGDRPTPKGGTPVQHPETEKEVGWVTTAVVSPRLRETIALAFVRREREPGSTVHVGGEPAEVVALPFPADG